MANIQHAHASGSTLDDILSMPSEETLVGYVLQSDIPSLIAAIAAETGDLTLLDPKFQPHVNKIGIGFAPQGGLDQNKQTEVARILASRIRDLAVYDAEPPAEETLEQIIHFLTGMRDGDYLDLLKKEMGIEDDTTSFMAPIKPGFKVAVVGAGVGGIAITKLLLEAGIECKVFERNPAVGGVWWENKYPGCRLDTFNFAYSFSFAQRQVWPDYYSKRSDVYEYVEEVAEKVGLVSVAQFNTEVLRATYDPTRCIWTLESRKQDFEVVFEEFNCVITATGALNRPKYPDIPGVAEFAGQSCHTARWTEDMSLNGKRVAVIGTGASAYQVVPAIRDQVSELFIFQRSAPWMLPSPDYCNPISQGLRWLLENIPSYHSWYRFWQFWLSTEGRFAEVQRDPSWELEHSASAANERLRKGLVEYLSSQYPHDPELQRSATPTYPPNAKRMLRDNGMWAATLQSPNTRLVTDAIERIDTDGIYISSGVHIEVDAIVYATGFKVSEILAPIEFAGLEGQKLHEFWDGDPRSLDTVTVPGFPNLFMVGGPNTGLAAVGSQVFMLERSAEYVMNCLEYMFANGIDAISPHLVPFQEFNSKLDANNELRVWGTPGVDTWYKNGHGRVSQLWPNRLLDYWQLTRGPNPQDYQSYFATPQG